MAKILIVDDEPEIRFLARMFLEKANYHVTEAEDAKSAFGEINKEKPDLVLLDVVMPDMLGWEVCRRIKESESTKSIPLVMFTIRGMAEDKRRSAQCGASAHIVKPFEKEELLGTIQRLLPSS